MKNLILKYKRETIVVILLLIYIFVFIPIYFKYFITTTKPVVEHVPVKLQQPEFFLSDTPNDTLVYEACIYYGIHHPEIVVAQSILETGYYRSEGCKKDNNLFGLYNSSKKQYFKFNHWTESVKAYKNMIQYKYRDNEDYYHFLDRIGYAEDSLYNNKIKSICNVYKIY